MLRCLYKHSTTATAAAVDEYRISSLYFAVVKESNSRRPRGTYPAASAIVIFGGFTTT